MEHYLALTWLLAFASASAQEPVTVNPVDVRRHQIGHYARIHSRTRFDHPSSIRLQVVVDESGTVEEAKPLSGPEEFFDQAIESESKRKFKPFEQNGVPIRATFEDYVSILPPEEWSDKDVPFPEVKDWNTLKIHLKRTPCYGGCPVYSLEISGNQETVFDGTYNVLVTGHHHGTISKHALEDLVAVFRRANYLSLKDAYNMGVTDVPTFISSIEFDGIKKSVVDEVGLEVGMPEVATKVEEAIDQFADTEKWIKGNAQTGPALMAEHWDFQSNSEENRKLFANVVAFPDLVRLWTAKGLPPLAMTKDGVSPLITAAKDGNYDLVKSLLTAQRGIDHATMTCALAASAHSGNLSLVQCLISKGADTNGPFCADNRNVLMEAALSGKAEVVQEILTYKPDVNARGSQQGLTALTAFLQRPPQGADGGKIIHLLISAGADVNIRDTNQQNTPIFYACSSGDSEAVRLLIQAGANVNARNFGGYTVLMNCFASPAVFKLIIEAGADLSIKNNQGQTAAELARFYGFKEKPDFLEAAEKAQIKLHP